MTGPLGADRALVGLIEGIAETTASLTKLWSGRLADRVGRLKLLVGIGYGVSAVARPFMALACSPWHVLGLRFADRIGKGIRTSPRDALLMATTIPGQAGRAFGLHRSLDQLGAVLGPALAALLLTAFAGRYGPVFLLAALPGFASVLLIVTRLREVPPPAGGAALPPLRWSVLGGRFKAYLAAVFLLGLANSSNAFLILRAKDLGVPEALVPVAYMLYNLVVVLISIPAGSLSDRIGRPRLLAAGFATFALVYLGFGAAFAAWQAWLLFAAYGLFSGLTEGVERAYVGDLAPAELRGTAYGLFHLTVGLAALPASLLMGWLWDSRGAGVAFYVAAGLATAALAVFLTSEALVHLAHRRP